MTKERFEEAVQLVEDLFNMKIYAENIGCGGVHPLHQRQFQARKARLEEILNTTELSERPDGWLQPAWELDNGDLGGMEIPDYGLRRP